MQILVPIIALGSLGFLFGLGLAVAAKKFHRTVDPRLEKIENLLPGVNCGVCGTAGCVGFAQALVKGEYGIEACRVLDEGGRKKIAEILGIEVKPKIKEISILHCSGGKKVQNRFQYDGLKDCAAANLVLGGQKACAYGCLEFASCVKACPFGAITMGEEGLPLIDEEKCTACGKCVEVCPKGLFTIVPINHNVYICCSSNDIGKKTKEVCPVGCIACKLCEKACPVDAIKVVDNLARIDYTRCNNCGECIKVCPTKVIKKRGKD